MLRRGPRLDCGASALARVIQNAHTEAVMRFLRGRLSDTAETHQPESFAGNPRADHPRGPPTVPLVGPDLTLSFTGTACRHQHQEDRRLGGRVREHIRRVGHDDSQAPAGLQIDVTDTHTIVAEYFHLTGTSGEDLGGEFVTYGGTNGIV